MQGTPIWRSAPITMTASTLAAARPPAEGLTSAPAGINWPIEPSGVEGNAPMIGVAAHRSCTGPGIKA